LSDGFTLVALLCRLHVILPCERFRYLLHCPPVFYDLDVVSTPFQVNAVFVRPLLVVPAPKHDAEE